MNEIPCKECITLSICQNSVTVRENSSDVNNLLDKCSLLREFVNFSLIRQDEKFIEVSERVIEILKFYNQNRQITDTSHVVITTNTNLQCIYCEVHDKLVETVFSLRICPICMKNISTEYLKNHKNES